MKILIQWAQKNSQDWIEIDSSRWTEQPKLSIPEAGQLGGQNNTRGWIQAINIQGVVFSDWDHYAAEEYVSPLGEHGVRIIVWNDNPIKHPVGRREAQIRTFLPLAPDPALGGAWNTRQTLKWYADPGLAAELAASPHLFKTLPYASFVPSSNPIHGVGLAPANAQKHNRLQSRRGWREWNDGVPPGALDNQRAKGRFKPNTHTRTYYTTPTDSDWDLADYQYDKALAATSPGSTTNYSWDVPAGGSVGFTI